MQATTGVSRRKILALLGVGGAAGLAAACGNIVQGASSPSKTGSGASSAATSGSTSVATSATASGVETWLYLSIITGKQDGDSGYPEFLPAIFSVPANATVHAEIRCFDDGPAAVPSGYNNVKGTVGGTMTVISAVNGDLSTAKTQTVQSIDASNVAHTMTFADTGLNIPIPPLSTVRFDFLSGPAGSHGWQCMAACGSGTGGWGGPMATAGFMQGTMTVQA